MSSCQHPDRLFGNGGSTTPLDRDHHDIIYDTYYVLYLSCTFLYILIGIDFKPTDIGRLP